MTSALALAAEVRSGRRSARAALEEALDVVEVSDGEVHAFLSLLATKPGPGRRGRRHGGGGA